MIQRIVFIIFINSALLTISAIPPAVLSPISNFQKTNNETMLKEELIKNYLQQLLPNSKDFNTAHSNYQIIVGELITKMKINFENNYRELEQILMIFWTTFKSMNNLIGEMKSSRSSIQRLLQKFDNINFNEY